MKLTTAVAVVSSGVDLSVIVWQFHTRNHQMILLIRSAQNTSQYTYTQTILSKVSIPQKSVFLKYTELKSQYSLSILNTHIHTV